MPKTSIQLIEGPLHQGADIIFLAAAHLGVSENRGPEYSTLNSRILLIKTPK